MTIEEERRPTHSKSFRIAHVLGGSILAGLIAFLAGVALAESEAWRQTVKGEVQEVETDADGNVLRVSIDDGEWGPVLVADDARGRELARHVGEEVAATGKMHELEEEENPFEYLIVVETFTFLDDPSGLDDPEAEPDESGDLREGEIR